MDISQDVISSAGLSPKTPDLIYGDVLSAYGQKDAALKAKAGIQVNVTQLNADKATALAPKMDEMAKSAEAPPPEAPKLERAPAYEKPTLTPKEVQDNFGLLMAASMLVGASSRAPFYGVMQAMTGALQGYQNRDDQLVKISMESFDKNLAAIKERNDAARQEFDLAWKKYSGNLPRLKQELEIIGAKYDLPIATENARVAGIDSAVKEFDNTIKSGETMLVKLQQMAEKQANDQANREQRAQQAREHNDTMRELAASRQAAAVDKGWKLMKDKAGQVYRVNVNAGLSQKQGKSGWEDVVELPGDVMNVGAKENQGRMFEEKAGMQYNTMKLAMKELDGLEKQGIQNMPFLGDIHFDSATGRLLSKHALTDEEQQLITAAQLFAEAAGHLERGANLTDQQFQRVVREFIPQPGDKDGTLKEKKDHRQNLLHGAQIVSGEVGAKIDKESAAQPKAEGTNTPEEEAELKALRAAMKSKGWIPPAEAQKPVDITVTPR